MFRLADEGCERIARVTRNLLDFARVDTQLEKTPYSPNRLAEEVIDLVQLKASSKNVTIRYEATPDLPNVVLDPQAIKEALVNLLMNGVDACLDNGGKITIRTRSLNPDLIEIAIIDNGAGIASEIEGRIFEPFITTKKIGQGTGLGLSVARRIVEAHDGTITVEPTPGGGTTFRIRLPARPTSQGEGVSDGREDPDRGR